MSNVPIKAFWYTKFFDSQIPLNYLNPADIKKKNY